MEAGEPVLDVLAGAATVDLPAVADGLLVETLAGASAAIDERCVVLGRVDAEGGLVDHADQDGVAGLEDA